MDLGSYFTLNMVRYAGRRGNLEVNLIIKSLDIKILKNIVTDDQYLMKMETVITLHLYYKHNFVCVCMCVNFSKITRRANIKLSTIDLHSGAGVIKGFVTRR